MFWLGLSCASTVEITVESLCMKDCMKFSKDTSDALAGQDPRGFASVPDITIYNFVGGGMVVADFNGDGEDDIYLPTQVQDELFLGRGDGSFEKTVDWLPQEELLSVGGAAADYDGDGDLDLYVTTNYSSDRLYRNEGSSFVDVSKEAGLLLDASDTAPAVWQDYDLDGDLDLYVGGHLDTLFEGSQSDPDYVFPAAARNVLYINQGNGTFDAEIHAFFSPEPFTLAVAWLQYERGSRPDLYLINDFGPLVLGNRLLTPQEDGFMWHEGSSGSEIDMYGMGVSIGDLNKDGLPDLWMSNWMEPVLLLSTGPREWYDATSTLGLQYLQEDQRFSWGTAIEDLDNDGDLDAWLGYGPLPQFEDAQDSEEILDDHPTQPDAFFLHTDQGFTYYTDNMGLEDDNITRSGIFCDFNRDGALDLLRSSMLGPAEIFWGTPTAGNWLEIQLHQEGMNQYGVGAKIDVFSEEEQWTQWVVAGSSFASGGPLRVHFGFGAQIPTEITVTWPDGGQGSYVAPEPNQRIKIHR